MDKGTSDPLGKSIGAGIAIGAGFGVALGTALDNLALGIALGMSLGVALGAAYGTRNGRDAAPASPNAKAMWIGGVALGVLVLFALIILMVLR